MKAGGRVGCRVVVDVALLNTEVILFVGVLLSGLEEKGPGRVFFKPCKHGALRFSKGQKQ